MFYSTQEAVKFGLEMDSIDRKRLSRLRNTFMYQFDVALCKERLNLASMFATQAQFCREAVEAHFIVDKHPELFKDLV